MRRVMVVIVVLVVLLMVFPSRQYASFGIKGGLNFSKFSYANFTIKPDFSTRTNLILGGFLNLKIAGPLSLQAEIYYSSTGSSYDGPVSDLVDFLGFSVGNLSNIFIEYKITYLEIPVLLKLSFDMVAMKPYVFAGPFYRTKLSESIKVEYLSVSFDVDPELFEKTDYGFSLGAGINFNLGVTALLVEARYSLGLKDIHLGDETLKNEVVSIMAGIEF